MSKTFEGAPCIQCSCTERYLSNGSCKICSVERAKKRHRETYVPVPRVPRRPPDKSRDRRDRVKSAAQVNREEARAMSLCRYLGSVCRRGHDEGGGRSIRLVRNSQCVRCRNEDKRGQRLRNGRPNSRGRRTRAENAARMRKRRLSTEYRLKDAERCRNWRIRKELERIPDDLRPLRLSQFAVNASIREIFKRIRK